MIRLLLMLLIAAAVVGLLVQMARTAAQKRRNAVWMPERITFILDRDDEIQRIGQYLHMRQAVLEGEEGWSERKLPLPEAWNIVTTDMEDGVIVLRTGHGELFEVGGHNFAALSAALAASGSRDEQALQAIWRKHARREAPLRRVEGSRPP